MTLLLVRQKENGIAENGITFKNISKLLHKIIGEIKIDNHILVIIILTHVN